MTIALQKITTEGMIDNKTILKISIPNTEKVIVITSKNINSFIHNTRDILGGVKLKTIKAKNRDAEIQTVSNLLTIQACMEYNNLHESDFSQVIEEIIHTAIIQSYDYLFKRKNTTLDDLYVHANSEFKKVLPDLYKKWTKENDRIGKLKFEKMMIGADKLPKEVDQLHPTIDEDDPEIWKKLID